MFRKIMLAAVLSLGFLAPLAIPAQSQARGPARVHAQYAHRVHYRTYTSRNWRTARVHGRRGAYRVAHSYRHRVAPVCVR